MGKNSIDLTLFTIFAIIALQYSHRSTYQSVNFDGYDLSVNYSFTEWLKILQATINTQFFGRIQ